MKKIAVGSLGEFWYGDYKEPFVQLEGAVTGYPQGVILKADDGKLLCPYCGKTYDNLGVHAARTHGLKKRDFKSEVGLLQSSALVSEKARQAHIRTALRLSVQGRLHQANGGYKAREDRLSPNPPERQNKTGRCRAQIMTVARQLDRQGKLTYRELRRYGIGQELIERWWATLSALKMDLGSRKPTRLYSDAELLAAFRNLAAELGRTPSVSDLRRYGGPSLQAFKTRWGNLGNTAEAAGLPRMPRGVPPNASDEAILMAYALRPNVDHVARVLQTGNFTVRRALHRYGFPFPPGSQDHIARSEWAAEIVRRLAGVAA